MIVNKKPLEIVQLRLLCDSFSGALMSKEGEVIHRYENSYVPEYMPGMHWGDYLILDIDLATGKITNWIPPTQEGLAESAGILDKEDDDCEV